MRKYTVQFEKVAGIQRFVRLMNKIPQSTELKSGRYIINAKSLMGIFSLDLSQPIRLTIRSDKDYTKELQEWLT